VRTAIEINPRLCDRLRIAEEGAQVINCDFLQFDAPATKYDRILMNPPFANADDIKHIRHALGMLKPGGKLVAICANGPRQNAQLRPLVEQHGGEWENLPPDTFAESGTAVNAALFTLTA
jgi:16S rRNA G1207 methylase RsmC